MKTTIVKGSYHSGDSSLPFQKDHLSIFDNLIKCASRLSSLLGVQKINKKFDFPALNKAAHFTTFLYEYTASSYTLTKLS